MVKFSVIARRDRYGRREQLLLRGRVGDDLTDRVRPGTPSLRWSGSGCDRESRDRMAKSIVDYVFAWLGTASDQRREGVPGPHADQ